MKTVRDLFNEGILRVAQLPAKNDYPLTQLDTLKGYTIPLVSHDYGAKTPLMWNTLYEHLDLSIRNIMAVADPNNLDYIFQTFRDDPKYLGGGAGVGFKEKVVPYLDRVEPTRLKAVNIIVKEDGKLVGYNTDAEGFVHSLEEKFTEIGSALPGKNIILFGAGGVAKEVAYLLAKKDAAYLYIINRTARKAVDLAHELNTSFDRDLAQGLGESFIRGTVLNSFPETKPHAIINLTDKGSDGSLAGHSCFAPADVHNETFSRTVLRELARYNPYVIVADIVLPKNKPSVSLRHADAAGIKHLLDGMPMVINQAGPAYLAVQQAHPDVHAKKVTLEEALHIFTRAAQ